MGLEGTSSKMSSDQDTDCSNPSPASYVESPYSSPSQQVPHLTNYMTVLKCTDGDLMDTGIVNGPFLSITEQPNDHFRFRYKSEMVGTHGCLIGKSSASNRTKTYPSVGLMNYSSRAIIKCSLAQYNKDEDHPHQLVEDEQEKDLSAEVNPQQGYEVRFQGLGIIHTSKKEVPTLLYKMFSETSTNLNMKELKMLCEKMAKDINLNIVRLKFSAHDIQTGAEICSPVFSEPIHNMKSAATNDLKICRMSRTAGRPRGCDDIFILTEKVNKKDIKIRFVEVYRGEITWTGEGRFLQNDVHHQYAIVFRSPKYKNPEITSDVKVYVELFRPSDGRTSQRVEFTYKAEEVFKQSKKRKANSYSSIGSSSGGSIKSFSDVPEPVMIVNQVNHNENAVFPNVAVPNIMTSPQNILHRPPLNQYGLSEALYDDTVKGSKDHMMVTTSPMLGQPNVPEPPVINLNSTEFDELLRDNNIPEDERKMFFDTDFSEYIKNTSYGSILSELNQHTLNTGPDSVCSISSFENMAYIGNSMQLTPDSGRAKGVPSTSRITQKIELSSKGDQAKNNYTALYTQEDGVEVKKLVKELCEIIRNRTQFKKQDVRRKLDRLFELRLSNGDTFLHMTLCNNMLPSMEYIVKLIHSLRMTHFLNEKNYKGQTILHLAVVNDLPQYIPFLIAKGCDPMSKDREGNNVVHYAVMCHACLAPLLDSMKKYNIKFDLNAVNADNQTALHLEAMYGSGPSAKMLLSHLASYSIQDINGRTPLHIAADDSNLGVMQALLNFIPASDIDAVDVRGYTALQIVCDINRCNPDDLPIVELLLLKGADPSYSSENNEPAYKSALKNAAIKELMVKYMPSYPLYDDDIKSEPEDEFESADEGDPPESGLVEMSAYILELADILDRSEGWRELAVRLKCDSLLNWYEKTQSPTKTLLTEAKNCQDDLTSISLAKILRDMGELEAASVILRYIRYHKD